MCPHTKFHLNRIEEFHLNRILLFDPNPFGKVVSVHRKYIVFTANVILGQNETPLYDLNEIWCGDTYLSEVYEYDIFWIWHQLKLALQTH